MQVNVPNHEPRRKEPNPMADSWKPEDKAAEAAFEKPAEFAVNHPAIEDSSGPVPSSEPKTHRKCRNPESKSSLRSCGVREAIRGLRETAPPAAALGTHELRLSHCNT